KIEVSSCADFLQSNEYAATRPLKSTVRRNVFLPTAAALQLYTKLRIMKSLLPMLLFCSMCFSQQALTGKIANRGGKPVSGANVFIKGSYDGGITDDLGRFEFQTSQKGSITLMV